ncbi:MAG TPA: energy-coupling factor ABC transporter permease [Candidatus Brocadiia bacterium]|nr:energy-coupling factor ABC transporter permease [Candidatus Brocadiia bacterium]
MHMADALISPAVGLGFWAVSGTLAARAARKLETDSSRAPMMGVLGAFVFAAQMINFTIPGTGSSGHLGGGLLLSILLGPSAALITITGVLTIQCLLFADGGLLALGCNIFNLGFYPCFIGLPIYRFIAGNGDSRSRSAFGMIAASVIGLELGALSVVAQTVLSGIGDLPFGKFILFMGGIHLPIGIVEGLVTVSVVGFVTKIRPAALLESSASAQSAFPAASSGILAALLCLALGIGGVLAWYASEKPDGLEWSVTRATGREELESGGGLAARAAEVQEKVAILPDYSFRESDGESAPSARAGTSTSGVVGSIVTLLCVSLAAVGIAAVRRGRSSTPTSAEP